MGKRKLKISLHRVRETKELWMVLHINVYRKEERNFTAVHLFLMVRNLSDFGFYYRLSVAYLCAKSDCNYSAFGGGLRLDLLLHGGLF
ncbi:hypothetical protein D3Z60_07125 [Lachnospiraceae bacterium]|nr:hypothetical protein [Lachnospiraceae bacterium]